MRDFVLGVKLVDGTGQVLNFGGQVMKNVAGYDLSRLFCGSRGSLGLITSVNFKDFPDVVNMVDDATDQLNKIKEAKGKADAAAAKKDWDQANLWSEQIWQYQVKAADIGLRAKTYLEQNGAKKVK